MYTSGQSKRNEHYTYQNSSDNSQKNLLLVLLLDLVHNILVKITYRRFKILYRTRYALSENHALQELDSRIERERDKVNQTNQTEAGLKLKKLKIFFI